MDLFYCNSALDAFVTNDPNLNNGLDELVAAVLGAKNLKSLEVFVYYYYNIMDRDVGRCEFQVFLMR